MHQKQGCWQAFKRELASGLGIPNTNGEAQYYKKAFRDTEENLSPIAM